MPKAGFIVARVCFLILAASMLGAGMLAAPAAASKVTCASSAGKCFAVAVSPPQEPPPTPPAPPPAGGTVPFKFTVTNEASTQQVGSFQITAPANFVITGASVSPPSTASFTPSSALFVNLSVAPSMSITVTVNAVLPCSNSSYTWGIEVKQSNNFRGIPGNDFQIDPASAGNLSGTPSGSCSLAFTSDGQPAGAGIAPAKIAADFNSQGGPVKVGLLDASGQLITSSAATGPVSVTVKIDSNPGGGSLPLGTTTEPVSGGVASFPALSIDKQGVGYTLIATASIPGISTSEPSAFFTIFGSLKHCAASSCSASLTSTTTTATVTTSSTTATAPLLGSTLGGASYSCATYQPVTDPFSFDVFDTTGAAQPGAQFSATLDISKSTVQSSGRTNALAWQLCYASTASFTALPGTLQSNVTIGGNPNYFTGLLPKCSATQGAPCLQLRKKGNCGDVIITFLAVGDPYGRP
jgi:hypothetical protein